MISDQTVDSFIISNCIPGSKFYNYLSISVSLEGAFSVIEQKDVVGISKKLEIRFQLWLIGNCEHLSAGMVKFYLPKIYRGSIKADFESMWVSFQRKR